MRCNSMGLRSRRMTLWAATLQRLGHIEGRMASQSRTHEENDKDSRREENKR